MRILDVSERVKLEKIKKIFKYIIITEFCKEFNFSRSLLSQYLNGQKIPSEKQLDRLLAYKDKFIEIIK